mmetsp:Transcript_24377/g.36165  ORF Transcript_24377/g.36165 Transcript_24377/m.36165 type:complete len:168 (-) Transcript_24377:368-871(-)|eukprot:CAMPEP_0194239526 /NCGR_PEP_ID=MMETSP0158-20130606/5956_1 /TAXON_ID=33649 /ORGANISM="Thalassionema nitzschioides, Strain L26-B" /LENGTH=167 /DNA_ID=CAMNT_0038974013 /DNA_START=888 /DNA_END=1391 /DNA_ORIENTATION=-
MTNHFRDGYLEEKTLNPYVANSVTITALPNIGKYANAQGMITCGVLEEDLRTAQRYYNSNFKWMPFNTTPDMWETSNIQPIKYDPYADNNKGDEPVLAFAESQWKDVLMPCIDETKRIDQEDNAYIEKLMQPYLLNGGRNSMFDGTYIAIRSLEGMIEQTPGWETVY